MRGSGLLAVAAALTLAGCAHSPRTSPGTASGIGAPAALAHGGDDLNQSGRPYAGPPGVPVSNPPLDNGPGRLTCHPEGPGTVCSRTE